MTGVFFRRDTKTALTTVPPLVGEIVYATDTGEHGWLNKDSNLVWKDLEIDVTLDSTAITTEIETIVNNSVNGAITTAKADIATIRSADIASAKVEIATVRSTAIATAITAVKSDIGIVRATEISTAITNAKTDILALNDAAIAASKLAFENRLITDLEALKAKTPAATLTKTITSDHKIVNFMITNNNIITIADEGNFHRYLEIRDLDGLIITRYLDIASGMSPDQTNKDVIATNGNLFSSSGFGIGLYATDSHIIVGSPFDKEGSGPTSVSNSGIFQIFDISGNLLRTVKSVNSSGSGQSERFFGQEIVANASIIVVGAPGERSVYIYNYDGTLSKKISVDIEKFGAGITLTSSRIIVSSATTTTIYDHSGTAISNIAFAATPSVAATDSRIFAAISTNAASSGLLYIYDHNGTVLQTIQNPNATDTASSDRFGETIKVEGAFLIVSAPGDGTENKGTIYLFNHSGELIETLKDVDSSNDLYFGKNIRTRTGKMFISSPEYTKIFEYALGSSTPLIVTPLAQRLFYDLKNEDVTTATTATTAITITQTLPTATLLNFKTAVYSIDDAAEYVCVSNILIPTVDTEVFWLQR